MLHKPPSCQGCPLFEKGLGFSRPEGTGALGVMIVGEALGEDEMRDGFPFRPRAQAGSLLERVIQGAGFDRQQFTLWNVAACRPPNNWLDGAPWEAGAIEHCRQHFRQVHSDRKPRVILALGNVATRALTGLAGEKRSVSYLRGYPFETEWGLVVPSFHPSFIRRGASELIRVLVRDLRLAVQIAKTGFERKPVEYSMYPSLDEARSFLLRVQDSPNALLTYDIETPRSKDFAEDEREDDPSYDIVSIQFSLAERTGIFFPWTPEYAAVAKEIMALSNTKANHNTWKYDNPRLRANNVPVNGLVHDTLWIHHHLEPDLPAHLQFVASFYGMDFAWKHLGGTEPERYGCADVDAVQRIVHKALAELESQGIARGYYQHILGLEPVLRSTSERGVPVDEDARVALYADLEAKQATLGEEIQTRVPDELKNVHPKDGYKREPKDTAGMVRRTFAGEEGQPLERWCKLKPFLPNSSDQLIRYMVHRGHPVPKDFKKGTDTTSKKELERVARSTKDPLYAKVIEWREYGKLLTTFLPGWKPAADGAVHTTFYYETGTGQLSSRGPNVQNAIKHSELGQRFRRIVQAKAGHKLVEFDYKSFHVLTLGFEAKDSDYMRAAKLDMHSLVSGHILKVHDLHRLFEKPDDELLDYFAWYKSDKDRKFHRDKKAKPAILGYGFGLGKRKLYDMNRESFASEAEAGAVISMLDELFPRTAAFRKDIRALAHRQGFLKSRHGYIRHFQEVFRKKWNAREGKWDIVPGEDSEAAIAFLPANDAFGHIKDVMLRLEQQGWNERAKFINTVHDSLVFHMPDEVFDEAVSAIYREMIRPSEVLVDPLIAPNGLAVDVEASVGPNWCDLKPFHISLEAQYDPNHPPNAVEYAGVSATPAPCG